MPSYNSRKLSAPKDQAAVEVQASQLGTIHAQHPRVVTLRTIVPFDQYALSGLDYPGLGMGAGIMLASDMPTDFLSRFLEEGLYPLDPMSARLSPETPWASWHDLSEETLSAPELGPINWLEKRYDIRTRSAVAFYREGRHYGGGIFTRDTPFTDQEKFILEAGARMIHTELSDLQLRNMAEHTGLNAGEISCLNAASQGMTAEDSSAATGFSTETVASHIKSATRKLGAANRTEAVAEAIRRRLIR